MTTVSFPSGRSEPASNAHGRDRWLKWTLLAGALVAGAVLLLVVTATVVGALPALQHAGQALLSADWAPGSGEFGMAAMLAASLAAAALALLIAAPLAVVLAAWLHLYAPAVSTRLLRPLYELLAGIPSVVYGLWGLIALVPLINAVAPPGANLLTASLVLAMMILPYGILITDSHLATVPAEQKQAALACGLSRWGAFRVAWWPLVRRGTFRAMVLQFGRALGETMAVLMVAGNVVTMPSSLVDPVRTLTANIALEMSYAAGDHRAALYLSGLMLLVLSMLLMSMARERNA